MKTKKIRVRVLLRDIAASLGWRNNKDTTGPVYKDKVYCQMCPIAIAMSRAFKEPITVNGISYRFTDVGGWDGWHSLPRSVVNKIQKFDHAKIMEPFTFEVEHELR